MIIEHKMATVTDAGGDGPGTFEVILSAPTLDRDNETVQTRAFDPLPARINFDIDHGMSVLTTVGSGVPAYLDDGSLKVKGVWASTDVAQNTRTLVREGHITHTSVAYMAPVKTKKEGKTLITKAELLNGSFVSIPANREAVILDAKAGARNSKSDAKRIQEIHDHTVALGAATTAAASDDESASKAFRTSIAGRVQKAVEGSYEELTCRLADALEDAVNEDPLGCSWAYVYATFSDHMIYRMYGRDGEPQHYTVPYTVDDQGVVTFGTSTPVDIVEVVVPDSDEAADVASGEAADPIAETAAKAAVQQEQSAALARIRRSRIEARQRAR